jgi:hypothetical protein
MSWQVSAVRSPRLSRRSLNKRRARLPDSASESRQVKVALNAIFSVLRTGCRWRVAPHKFCLAPPLFTGLVGYACTGGRRSFQGRACSSCAATWIRRSSRPKAATSWVPIGSPAAFQYNGNEIPGCPVRL